MSIIFEKMQHATNELLSKIHTHNFNIELAQGTLPQETFIFYLIQDALYLNDYARALSLVAARLSDNNHMQQFARFALDAIQSEKELHINYLNNFKQKQDLAIDLDFAQKSPTCFMYTNYLLSNSAIAPVETAAASLLPCFYIYHEVGKKMQHALYDNHPYYDWIALYSHPDFEEAQNKAKEVINELALLASISLKDNMLKAFYKATELEWLFWDSAYKKQTWVIDNEN